MTDGLFDELDPSPRLGDVKRLARAGDPATSHAASRTIVESGELAIMEAATLGAVRLWPGLCSNELEKEMGVQDGRYRKRLISLERRGLVKRGLARTSRVSGKSGETWYPT